MKEIALMKVAPEKNFNSVNTGINLIIFVFTNVDARFRN